MGELVDEVADLLAHLIRNRCVNDGDEASGHEVRSVDVLRSYLDGPGLDLETYESLPGRESLVARIEGSDPHAPTLMLMGHTDVVPANPDRWRHDPYGGELVDGVVWGRGAVDMLNLTASMAVATRKLADRGFRPKGTLVYLAVADEEAGGRFGAEWLARHQPDAVRTDYVVTELGGLRFPVPGPPKLAVAVAEKGPMWVHLRVTGTPGHGSMPYGTDNALLTAAEVVRRLEAYRPPTRLADVWQGFVGGLDLPPEVGQALLDPARIDGLLGSLGGTGLARYVHACTHTTITPTMLSAGTKSNVIPDRADITVDIRVLPGETQETVEGMLRDALGDLADRVEIVFEIVSVASESPQDTPLWDTLQRHAASLVPGASNIPILLAGGTDSRFLRELGAVCYGYGLYSERIAFDDFAAMFHGDDERIDLESLDLTTRLWFGVVEDVLG